MEFGIFSLPDPGAAVDGAALNAWVAAFEGIWKLALEAGGTPASKRGRAAPWWTRECQNSWKEFKKAKRTAIREENPVFGPSSEEKAYYTTVRQAKRDYWRNAIDSISNDKGLWDLVGWHKKGPRLRAPPLVHEGETISDPMEKAKCLQKAVLGRFSEENDLEIDPLEEWNQEEAKITWDTEVTLEEAQKSCIGVQSKAPGVDGITVRLLKASWAAVGKPIQRLFQRCLELSHFPAPWKRAEVAIMPKLGKKDLTSVRSWRPIALLSCLGKGLERLFGRRIAWAALQNGILSPTHGGALPKRSATDLICALMHEIDLALDEGKAVTIVTSDVQGAFDALLPKRLLKEMRKLGFDIKLLRFVGSFLEGRQARVRLESATTDFCTLGCGTPQGSPVSPVLYMLYLAALVKAGRSGRFAYADDILNWKASSTLQQNVDALQATMEEIYKKGESNKITFVPEKTEIIYITRKRTECNPAVSFANRTITPVPITDSGTKVSKIPGLRWLGYWFNRKNSGRRYVEEKNAKTMGVARHLRGLAGVKFGPPAAALRKAITVCVLPVVSYATEA